MGQYYRIINADKKESFSPWDFDSGAKLMEFGYNGTSVIKALTSLLMGEWKGDRVYIVGDYADTSDMSECWAKTYEKLYDEMEADFAPTEEDMKYGWSVYSMADKWDFPEYIEEDIKPRYIYNHDTEQYIDLEHCPIEWTRYYEGEAYCDSVSPLALLLAMGNDRGGGDYHNAFNSYDKVGAWVTSSEYISVEEDKLDGCEHYTEFAPDFTENKPMIPYTEKEMRLEDCRNKKGGE